jgi:hypothetical protein
MRLEKKREEELARRKGMTGRTIVAVIWLLISIVIGYFLVSYLVDQNYLNMNLFYQLGIPRRVPSEVFFWFSVLIVVAIMQFFLMFGFMIASPEGRRPTGKATLYSRNKDPFDEEGGRR